MPNNLTNPSDVVREFLHSMEAMDFDKGVQLIADDAQYINGPAPAVQGPAGVREALAPFFAPIEKNEFIVQRESATGDEVFVERLDRHKIPQGWFELPVTGVFEVKAGKIVYWRDYFDLATIQTAMTELMEQSS